MTKMTYNYMTGEEMRERLKAGEDALELGIEKWDRIADAMRLHNNDFFLYIGGETCALCVLYYTNRTARRTTKTNACKQCPYKIRYKQTCYQSKYGHWLLFYRSAAHSDAIAMREALRNCRQR